MITLSHEEVVKVLGHPPDHRVLRLLQMQAMLTLALCEGKVQCGKCNQYVERLAWGQCKDCVNGVLSHT